MISEIAFATRASSFWRTAAPTSEAFIRFANSNLCKRLHAPIVSFVRPERRGLINELAFDLFVHIHSAGSVFPKMGQPVDDAMILNAFQQSSSYIARSDGVDEAGIDPLSDNERSESVSILRNMESRFHEHLNARSLRFRPCFRGCGIIGACVGDLSTLECLYEIKAGDRPFRSTDFRQILIYCALAKNGGLRSFSSVELYNPRLGTVFSCPLEMLCFEVSGKNASELLHEITDAISSSGVSL